jgi:hypothetical protein
MERTDIKTEYLVSWLNLLTNLTDWAPADIQRWISQAATAYDMDNRDSPVYHEAPVYWVIEPIVLCHCPSISDTAYESMEKQALLALDIRRHDFAGRTDWGRYRDRIKVLTSHVSEMKSSNGLRKDTLQGRSALAIDTSARA